MTSRSIKIWWDSIGTGSVLEVLFGERDQTIKVVKLLIDRMKQEETLSISRRQMRLFAEDLNSGKLGVKYSYHNFYTKLVRKLLLLGLVEKEMIWSPKRKTTVWVYQLRLQTVPDRPPQSGFMKQFWQVAKDWNDLILA